MGNELITTPRGVAVREEFGAVQQTNQGDTAMAAVQAREQALVQARFIMAERHQRDWDVVRVRLLKHCHRPGFAGAAWYKKPTGRAKINGKWVDTFAEDVSARFAEVARQEIGNLDILTSVTYEDAHTRVITATVMDLQRNNRDSRDIVINKVTEKRGKKNDAGEWEPPEGREVLSQRVNTHGEPVYLVRATEDEIRQRMNAEISKAQRDETKRLIPIDILDDCRAAILATRLAEDKRDPLAARKKVIDAFASLEVMPDELANYLGHSLDKATPSEIDELRGLFTAIKDGEVTMANAMKMKYDSPGASSEDREDVAEQKLAALKGKQPVDAMPTEEEMKAAEQAALAEESREQQPPKPKLTFGGRK